MNPESLILAALVVPLAGALLIGITGRVSANLRNRWACCSRPWHPDCG